MARLADHAAGRPGAQALKDAGFQGAIRYMANSPDRGLPNKILTPEEAQGFKDAGMELVSNWQKGKGPTADWKRGYQGGVEDARAALDHHFATGGPGYRPIYFSVDEDVDLDTWNNLVLPYLQGAASVLGKEWVGVYGGQRSMWWAEEDGFKWRWQTKAWSRYDEAGKWNASLPVQWEPGVQIRQERVDQDTVAGIGVDVNTTWADDYGQWSKSQAPTPIPEAPVTGVPEHQRLYMYGNGSSSRNGSAVLYSLLHTQEGGPEDGSGAESLARYCDGTNNVSYHEVIGAGKLIHVVPDDKASWSVLDANRYTHNVVFAGSKASWSRDQWLRREHDIRIAAWHMVGVCKAKGIPIRTVNTKQPGMSDHNFVTVVLGIGTHTDVGKNFPWDKFVQFIQEYDQGTVAAPPVTEINMINREAVRAGAWIGERKTVGEIDVPGGGKRAEFANGQIYWHERIEAAHAIPNYLFESYSEYGWEGGFLGYPVADHTVLPGGNVQAFENGVLYRQNDKEHGYYVHGYIYAAWRSAGYEKSIYGYPTSLEYAVGTNSRAQDFEYGKIVWSPNGTIGMKPINGPDEIVETQH